MKQMVLNNAFICNRDWSHVVIYCIMSYGTVPMCVICHPSQGDVSGFHPVHKSSFMPPCRKCEELSNFLMQEGGGSPSRH